MLLNGSNRADLCHECRYHPLQTASAMLVRRHGPSFFYIAFSMPILAALPEISSSRIVSSMARGPEKGGQGRTVGQKRHTGCEKRP